MADRVAPTCRLCKAPAGLIGVFVPTDRFCARLGVKPGSRILYRVCDACRSRCEEIEADLVAAMKGN